MGWARIYSHQPPTEGLPASILVREALKGPMLCLEPVCSLLQDSFHSAFVPLQDSIYDEMEDKWLKKKAEWEKDEKLEREKILLQQSEYKNFSF